MDNNELIEKVKALQANEKLHPLTCGNNSKHALLEPVEQGGEVVLRCNDCDYVQPVWSHLISVVGLLNEKG